MNAEFSDSGGAQVEVLVNHFNVMSDDGWNYFAGLLVGCALVLIIGLADALLHIWKAAYVSQPTHDVMPHARPGVRVRAEQLQHLFRRFVDTKSQERCACAQRMPAGAPMARHCTHTSR